MQIDTSTIENPVAFFEHVLLGNGIAILRKDFEPTTEDEDYFGSNLTYNLFTEEKEQRVYDPTINDVIFQKTSFRDFIYSRCKVEYNKTIRLIDEKILTIPHEDSIGVYINVLLERLKYIRKSILINNEVEKYFQPQKFPDSLEKLLSEKYNSYIKKPKYDLNISPNIILPLEQYQTHSITNKQKSNPGTFKWEHKNPEKLSKILYDFLSENKMIETSIVIFSKAFSGEDSKKPLNIKWTDSTKSNSHVNKITLLYLFLKLTENKMIATAFDSDEMILKLTFIFVDSMGKQLQNWNQSKSSFKKSNSSKIKKTRTKKLIDSFILTFCQLK